ncbi:hypothetical protein [Staphylococcus shinii]
MLKLFAITFKPILLFTIFCFFKSIAERKDAIYSDPIEEQLL